MRYDPGLIAKAKQEEWRGKLIEAADIVRKRGLCKGTLEDEDGRVCLRGALNAVYWGSPVALLIGCNSNGRIFVDGQVLRYLRSRGFIPVTTAHWNNEPERTAEEVIDVLEGAAFMDMAP